MQSKNISVKVNLVLSSLLMDQRLSAAVLTATAGSEMMLPSVDVDQRLSAAVLTATAGGETMLPSADGASK